MTHANEGNQEYVRPCIWSPILPGNTFMHRIRGGDYPGRSPGRVWLLGVVYLLSYKRKPPGLYLAKMAD